LTVFSSEKHSNTKFNENQSNNSRVVPCRQTDGQTDMTKLTFALRNLRTRLKVSYPFFFIGKLLVTDFLDKQPL